MPRFETGAIITTAEPEKPLTYEEFEAARRFDPDILNESIYMLVSRHFEESDASFIGTADIDITLEGSDATTVFAGYDRSDHFRVVIYLRDPQTRQAAEWLTFVTATNPAIQSLEHTITDGQGREITLPADRQTVREIIDAMESEYTRRATEAADHFDTRGLVSDEVDRAIADTEARLATLRQERETAEYAPEPLSAFHIVLHSGWAAHGEQSIDQIFTAPSLSAALRQATDRFKQVNKRSDVQTIGFSVSVSADGEHWHTIPNEVTLPLYKTLCLPDSESSKIQLSWDNRKPQTH